MNRQEFINKLAPFAIADMIETNVPASLTIAQGILESADGNSGLAIKANNLFGIKGTGIAGFVEMPTTEFVNGKPIKTNAKFRKYNNWGESVSDHSALFQNGVSWNRQLYHGVIGQDGITAAKEVAKAGYATDPDYSAKLIKLIIEFNLQQYDKKKPKPIEKDDSTRITELEEIVTKIIVSLTTIADRFADIPAPDWFISEFPDALNLINQKTGTIDFWRAFAVALRILRK